MTDQPINFAERRWGKDSNPSSHNVADALTILADRIRRGEVTYDHVIIAAGRKRTEENVMAFTYYQAGQFNNFEQLGLMHFVTDLIASD